MELNASNPSNTMDRPLITYYSELGTVSKGTLDDEPDGFYVYSLPSQDLLYDSFDSIQEQIHSRLIDLDNLIIERLFGNQRRTIPSSTSVRLQYQRAASVPK